MKILIILISMLVILLTLGFVYSEQIEEIKCNIWNNYQCLDENSSFYGCNIEEKVCYNYCQDSTKQV